MKKWFALAAAFVLTGCPPMRNSSELQAWNEAKSIGTEQAYRDYVRAFPEGCKRAVAAKVLRKEVMNKYCAKKSIPVRSNRTGEGGTGNAGNQY